MSELATYISVADGISKLFHPQVEVVIHDAKSNKIFYVANPTSKRKAGEKSNLSIPVEEEMPSDVLGPYEKSTGHGRTLKKLTSITSVLRNKNNVIIGLMCINFDRAPLDDALKQLALFIAPTAAITRPESLFAKDWRKLVGALIQEHTTSKNLTQKTMKRKDYIALFQALDKAGIFEARYSAEYVADLIGKSRGSVYSYLKLAREKG